MKKIKVLDKEFGHWSTYWTDVAGIDVSFDPDLIITFYYNNNTYVYFNTVSFYEFLCDLSKTWSEETLLIYTFNIDSVWLVLKEYIADYFAKKALYLNKYNDKEKFYKFEIRILDGFVENYEAACNELHIKDNVAVIAQKYAQQLTDEIFVNERYFYLTRYQRIKKQLEKAAKNEVIIFPDWADYQRLKNASRGGICFAAFPGLELTDLISFDRTSAYPAELVAEKFPCGIWEDADKECWSKYDFNEIATLGKYEITFNTNKYSYLARIYSEDGFIQSGTIIIWLTDVDLEIFKQLTTIKHIKCLCLMKCKKDYVNSFLRTKIVELYTTKNIAKQVGTEFQIAQAKKALNSVFGNLIRKVTTITEYNNLSKKLNPAWGIWCTAYARKRLIDLILQLNIVVYGDTDSVYCTNCKYNINTIHNFNKSWNAKIKQICNKFNIKYELLAGIGEFKTEHNITKFVAQKVKQYAFITNNNKEIVKCSGYEKGTLSYKDVLHKNIEPPAIDLFLHDDDGSIIKFEKVDLTLLQMLINK